MKKLLLLSCCTLFTVGLSAQVLLLEEFENGWPSDFIYENVDGLTPDDPDLIGLADSAWTVRYITQAGYNSNTAFSVSWYENDAGPSDDWMILPAVTVEDNTILSWTAMAITSSGNFRDRYQVAISTAGTDLADFFDNPLLFDTESTGEEITPQDRMVNLSEAGYTGETVHIAFRNFTAPFDPDLPVGPGNGGNELMIDNIKIEANVVGTENINADEIGLTAYPNPASTFLQLEFELAEATELNYQVVDMMGRVLLEVDLGRMSSGNHQQRIETENLASGQYILRLRSEHWETKQAFLKK